MYPLRNKGTNQWHSPCSNVVWIPVVRIKFVCTCSLLVIRLLVTLLMARNHRKSLKKLEGLISDFPRQALARSTAWSLFTRIPIRKLMWETELPNDINKLLTYAPCNIIIISFRNSISILYE